jgi:hypothetical protein
MHYQKSPYSNELDQISTLISTPNQSPQNRDDVLKFICFSKSAWEDVNNLLTQMKLARPTLSEGDMKSAILNQVIDEITSIRNDIHFIISVFNTVFMEQFGGRNHTFLDNSQKEILLDAFYVRLSIEESKIKSDLEVILDLVEKNKKKLSFV